MDNTIIISRVIEVIDKYFVLFWQDGVIGGIIASSAILLYGSLGKTNWGSTAKFLATSVLTISIFLCFGHIQKAKLKENPCEKQLTSCQKLNLTLSETRTTCEKQLGTSNDKLSEKSSESIECSNRLKTISFDNEYLKKNGTKIQNDLTISKRKVEELQREMEKCNSFVITPEM